MIPHLPAELLAMSLFLALLAFAALCGLLLVLWLAFFDRPVRPQSRPTSPFSLFKPRPVTGFRNFDTATHKASHDLQAHASLVRLCGGDVAKVERLIAVQQCKGKARAQATRDALDALLYDRHYKSDKSHKPTNG